MTTPTTSDSADGAGADYAVQTDDNITLLASKIIRDVLVTRDEPIRRAQLLAGCRTCHGGPFPGR